MPPDDVSLSQLPLKFLFSSSWSFKTKNRHYSRHNDPSTFHAQFTQFCHALPLYVRHHGQFRFPPTRPNISSHTTANTAPIDAATTTIPPTTAALPSNADVWLVVVSSSPRRHLRPLFPAHAVDTGNRSVRLGRALLGHVDASPAEPLDPRSDPRVLRREAVRADIAAVALRGGSSFPFDLSLRPFASDVAFVAGRPFVGPVVAVQDGTLSRKQTREDKTPPSNRSFGSSASATVRARRTGTRTWLRGRMSKDPLCSCPLSELRSEVGGSLLKWLFWGVPFVVS